MRLSRYGMATSYRSMRDSKRQMCTLPSIDSWYLRVGSASLYSLLCSRDLRPDLSNLPSAGAPPTLCTTKQTTNIRPPFCTHLIRGTAGGAMLNIHVDTVGDVAVV